VNPAHLLVTCVVPLALWILLSGLDDLFISLTFLFTKRPFPWPADAELDAAPEKRIAILVPLWQEDRVIGQMLEHNLAAIRYSAYDVFVGVYPNDQATLRAVEDVARRHERVRVVVGGHNGPTSKGDCLNSIYRGIERHEARHGVRYDIVMTHDAEDLVDPESLKLVNWFSPEYAMVQIPVLALPTPIGELTHGLYCDEFAEYQTKDIPVRQRLGGFLPGNGVGTGFERKALQHLAKRRGGMIFDPACLTEDYENGLRLHALGYRQIFVPVKLRDGRAVATREYFPRNFRSAARQRSRWVAGIALQGWQNHGWGGTWRQAYWFGRDRKGLVGNLLSPWANILFLAGLASGVSVKVPEWLSHLWLASYAIAFAQTGMRMWCSARIYGWRFAAAVPVRVAWGNVVNFVATAAALQQFGEARLRRRGLAWRKTEHVYPRPRLNEVLVRMGILAKGELEEAAAHLAGGQPIGEYLVRAGKLAEEDLYRALGEQAGISTEPVTVGDVDRLATRLLPAEASRRWQVLPFRVQSGKIHVAVGEIPSAEAMRELSALTALEIRYRLVRPTELARLSRLYLSTAA
jgi:adsorption protein B